MQELVKQHVLEGAHTGHVNAVTYEPHGIYLLSTGSDKKIALWKDDQQLLLCLDSGHTREVMDVQVSEIGGHFASASADRLLFLWDAEKMRVIRRYHGHEGRINAVAFFKDTLLASASYDRTTRLWDLRQRDQVCILGEAKDSVEGVQVSSHLIQTVSSDGCLRSWDARNRRCTTDFISTNPLTSCHLNQDDECTLVAGMDGLSLVDLETGTKLITYKGAKIQKYRIRARLSPTEEFLASGSEDNNVLIWNFLDENPRILPTRSPILDVCWKPSVNKDSVLTAACLDGSIVVCTV